MSAVEKIPPFGVVILAAGASSRMGRPKLLLPWHGTTIIGHLIAQWHALGVEQIAVVHRPNDLPLAAELDKINFPKADRIENPQPGRGMFSSIVCAAWAGWKEQISSWIIVLGDQPHLKPESLRQLLEFHAAHPGAICQPEFQGEPKHPVILPKPVFFELRTPKVETLKDFLKQTPGRRVQCPMDDAGLSLDLDTPEDYKKALQSP